MKVLIACEESQAVCKAFREKGHEAYSCDIIECSGGHPEWHIKCDVLNVINQTELIGANERGIIFETADGLIHDVEKWDLIIAHPPCTYMSKAGARWMFQKAGQVSQDRLKLAMAAKQFFFKILNADCERICVENPRPLKIVGLPVPTQIIQPYQFGHPYSKATCLWLKNLRPLQPTEVLEEHKPFLPSNTGAFSRGGGGSRGVAHNAKDASKTFPGIAKAMAEQWGDCS